MERWCTRPGGAELALARVGGRRASARMVVARGWPIQVAVVAHLMRNPCSSLARAGDGDGHRCHILSWKHHCEVCALLRLRPRLRRVTSDLKSGDGGAIMSLPC
jgi:hypothetical protein